MTDLRQGVTHAAHQALDLLDQLRDQQGDSFPIMQLDLGKSRAQQAMRVNDPHKKRHYALQAAAHLILAVELNDAALAAGGGA